MARRIPKPGEWVAWGPDTIAFEGDTYDLRFDDGSVRKNCMCQVPDDTAHFVPVNRHDRAPSDPDAFEYEWMERVPSAIRLRRFQ